MNDSHFKELLIEIAKMYYYDKSNQTVIAKKFNISRSQVSKYLALARHNGIVEIKVIDEILFPFRSLEDRVRKKYDLEDVVCVSSENSDMIKSKVGQATAKYLAKIAIPNMSIGVSAGSTLHMAANAMQTDLKLLSLTFIPLIGGIGKSQDDLEADVICDIFARKTGGNAIQLHAPLVVDDEDSKDVFMRQQLLNNISYIKENLAKARDVDVALVGIGSLSSLYDLDDDFVDSIQNEKTNNLNNIAGIILYNFFDDEGNSINCSWNNRVIGLSLVDLLKIPRVIGIAFGPEKVSAIHAALKNELVNVLITDENTCRILIDS